MSYRRVLKNVRTQLREEQARFWSRQECQEIHSLPARYGLW